MVSGQAQPVLASSTTASLQGFSSLMPPRGHLFTFKSRFPSAGSCKKGPHVWISPAQDQHNARRGCDIVHLDRSLPANVSILRRRTACEVLARGSFSYTQAAFESLRLQISDLGATSCCSWEQAAPTHCRCVRHGCPGLGKSSASCEIDPPTALVFVPCKCRAPMLQVSDRRNLLVVLVWAIHGWMAGIIAGIQELNGTLGKVAGVILHPMRSSSAQLSLRTCPTSYRQLFAPQPGRRCRILSNALVRT